MNRVEENESIIAALEDEAIEVECLLVEPKDDHISVDGVLCFGKENPEKCMEIKGGPDSISTREAEDNLKVFDVTPHEVDEVENFQAASGVPCACDDYLLDFEYAESVSKMDHVPSEELHLGIFHSESQITGFSECDNNAPGISKLSAIFPVPEGQNDLVDNTICELHCVLRSKCGCETPVEDRLWLKCPISYELQSINKLENFVSNILDRGISPSKNEKGMIFAEVGRAVEKESLGARDVLKSSSAKERVTVVLPTRKRSRKPPQRYIEESSDLSSRHCRRRQRISTSTPSDKFSGVRCYKHQDIASKAMTLVTKESIGRIIPVPFGPPVQREGHKKHASIVEPKEEPFSTESEDEHATTLQVDKSDSRRKHHRLWTLSEVRKLIDGVSQHGVGKWTVIKKLLFSSSAHRTPVDLKDKWRNLLRTSCLQTQSKREDEHKQKTAWRPLPKSVIRRVSELAVVHPYPRDRKPKISPVHRLSSPALPARSTGAPSSISGRTVRRKIIS